MIPSPSIPAREHTIATAEGEIFAASWTPPNASDAQAPLLLMHDSLGSVGQWRELPAVLAAATGRQVVAYDRRGHGRSSIRTDAVEDDFIEREAQVAVPQVLAALGIGRFAVLGHSVGGAMALACAVQWPGRCTAVVSIAAQAYAEELTREGVRAAMAFFANPENAARLARWHADGGQWAGRAWPAFWLHERRRDFTLVPMLKQVHCPVLVIHGRRDEYGSPAQAQAIADAVQGGSRIVLLPDVGHIPHRDAPQRVLGAIVDFLKTH